MGIGFVGAAQNPGVVGVVTSVAVPIHASTQPGDFVLVSLNGAVNGTPAAQAGWTTILILASTGAYSAIYYRIFQSGDSYNPTFTGLPSGRVSSHSVSYSGVDQTTPLDVAVPATSSGTTSISFQDSTPVTAGAWIIGVARVIQANTTVYSVTTTNLTIRSTVITPNTDATADGAGAIGDVPWVSGTVRPVITSVSATSRTRGQTLTLRPAAEGAPAADDKFFAFI